MLLFKGARPLLPYPGGKKMHGVIASFDLKTHLGTIRDESGATYSFSESSFTDPNYETFVIGDKVYFEPQGTAAAQVSLLDSGHIAAGGAAYDEPERLELLKDSLPAGFVLIDKGQGALCKGARDVSRARQALLGECSRLGANAILNFKVKKQVKSTVGYAFYYYYAYGVPAVIGRPNRQGRASAAYLKGRLKHAEIARAVKISENISASKIVFKVLGVILFIIFAAGFIISSM